MSTVAFVVKADEIKQAAQAEEERASRHEDRAAEVEPSGRR